MKTGFLVLSRPTQVEVEVFEPSDRSHPLVSHSRQDGNVAVLAGRVYFQRDLLVRLATLDRDAANTSAANDAALALAAFNSLGLKGLEILE